jgi:hypothetical protein
MNGYFVLVGAVCLAVEDVALSCDVHHVYSKVKMTVGTVAVHNFTDRYAFTYI